MIRGGQLSRVERLVASVIGVAVVLVSGAGISLALADGGSRLFVASAGGLALGGVFIAAARAGRALSWRAGRSGSAGPRR